MTRFERRFRKLSRSLSQLELIKHSQGDDSVLDMLGLVAPSAETRRFLDFYGDEGLMTALEHYGVLEKLRRLGLEEFEFELHVHEDQHSLFGFATHRNHRDRRRISELVVRRIRMIPDPLPGMPPLDDAYDVLAADWVCLQNPFETFSNTRWRLPGQAAPGLGIGEEVLELIKRMMTRLHLDAVLVVAGYLHNAVLYAPDLPFFNPWHMGRLQALERDVMLREGLDLLRASWAVEWGCVYDQDGEVVCWDGEAQLYAQDDSLRRYFRSHGYLKHVMKAEKQCQFRVDREAFETRWEASYECLLRAPEPGER